MVSIMPEYVAFLASLKNQDSTTLGEGLVLKK